MRVDLLTREYPPEVYGGAGVHVEYLARELRRLADVRVRCFGSPRDADHVYAYRVPGGLETANAALGTLGVDLEIAPGEFVESVRIPRPSSDMLIRIVKLSRRFDSDISGVCGAFALRIVEGIVSEARVAFGNSKLLAEALLDPARHIEVQIFGDGKGTPAWTGWLPHLDLSVAGAFSAATTAPGARKGATPPGARGTASMAPPGSASISFARVATRRRASFTWSSIAPAFVVMRANMARSGPRSPVRASR